MTKREAYKMARMNAAALIEQADLEQLYGGQDWGDEEFVELLAEAQRRCVEFIRPKKEGK